MELRKIFDTIPEQFDRYRPRYSAELFADLIASAQMEPGKTVLELGPERGKPLSQFSTLDAIIMLLSLGSI